MRIITLLAVAVFCGTSHAQEKGRDLRLASVDFKNATLDDVVSYFRECSGLNFHLDSAAWANDARVTLRLKDVPLMTALKLVLKPRDLECVIRDGVIVIAPRAGSQTVTRVYDTRDLMLGLEDFPGPRMELRTPGMGLGMGCYFIPIEEPRVNGSADFLADLVKANTGGARWESETSITMVNGLMVVTQSQAVHEEIQVLLNLLRPYK
jgi:hypothetical protein